MKKKFITAILVVAMCLSLAACDKNSDNTNQSSVISQEEVSIAEDVTSTSINLVEYTKDNNGIYNLTKEQALQFTTKVQLTNDNWQEYFDNRTTNHTEDGETVHYFGVADNYDIVMYNNVRFEAKTQINYYDDGICGQYRYLDDGRYYATYKEGTEPTDWQKVEGVVGSYYPLFADLNENHCFLKTDNTHYADIQLSGGEVVLIDIPDELWVKYNENDTMEYISIEGYEFARYNDDNIFNEDVYSVLFN